MCNILNCLPYSYLNAERVKTEKFVIVSASQPATFAVKNILHFPGQTKIVFVMTAFGVLTTAHVT